MVLRLELLAVVCFFCCAAATPEIDWHRSTLSSWSRAPGCSGSHLLGQQHAKCGAGAVFVNVPEDLAEEPHIEIHTVGAGGGSQPAPFSPDTLVEIASNSKVFTAVLLQRLVDRGDVAMTTRIGEMLLCPGEYKYPEVLNITLQELATHTSGLPTWPHNRRGHMDNPFAGYTHSDLCYAMEQLTSLPTKGKFYYSNLAFGLLGYLLELRQHQPFEDLVREHVLAPLGMNSTKITLSEFEWQNRVTPGVNPETGTGPVWRRSRYGVLRGNGAYHSNLADMARFVAAVIRAERDKSGPLAGPLVRMLKPITWDCPCVRGFCETMLCDAPTPEGSMVALAWQSFVHGSLRGWKKSGDVMGYSSLMAFSSQVGRGAFGYDTCGGCGVVGKSGSAIQRAVQALVNGPPSHQGEEEVKAVLWS